MATEKRTRKPCPACKESKGWRAADGICIECEMKLRAADQFAAEVQNSGELVAVKVFKPLLPYHAELAREVEAAFKELILSCTLPYDDNCGPTYKSIGEFQECRSESYVRVFSERKYEAFKKFADLIAQYVDLAYREGFDEGRRALVSLAQGKITPDKFADLQERKGSRRRDDDRF